MDNSAIMLFRSHEGVCPCAPTVSLRWWAYAGDTFMWICLLQLRNFQTINGKNVGAYRIRPTWAKTSINQGKKYPKSHQL